MTTDGWVLREPLKLLDSEDHPYLETALATLGRHELALTFSAAREQDPELKLFLDGRLIFEIGMSSPDRPWFELCRELGYDPHLHWDWDPALILFRQVMPAMARDWHEHALPYNQLGIPDGVICLATLQEAFEARVQLLRRRVEQHPEAAHQTVADCFTRLPLRAVIFHDDPQRRVDFVGNTVDEPYMGVFLYLGERRETAALISRATLHATGGMKWSPWLPGGDWVNGGREFVMTQGPASFLRAADLPDHRPEGFFEAFRKDLAFLCQGLEPLVEAYREAYPAGIPWHRDPRTRYLNRMIVDVRMGEHPVLILDDGSEVTVLEHQEEPVLVRQPFDVWGA